LCHGCDDGAKRAHSVGQAREEVEDDSIEGGRLVAVAEVAGGREQGELGVLDLLRHQAQSAKQHGIRLEVVKHSEAKRGFVLLPRRWVVERTFGWLGRFRRLARDYERLTKTLEGWHWVAALTLFLQNNP
jgi:hypothetical protein